MKPFAWLYYDDWNNLKLCQTMPPDNNAFPVYKAPRDLSADEIDICAEQTGMWCDGTPDAWDTEAIHNFANAVLKRASEK
jgi:hypothetical protein